VFSDLKRLFRSGGPISSLSVARVKTEYRSVVRSIFGGVHRGEPYALITVCSDVVDFLK
jgi:hypothetical protein